MTHINDTDRYLIIHAVDLGITTAMIIQLKKGYCLACRA